MISDFISTQPIDDFYILQEHLGEGAFAQVRKALFRNDYSQYAVKIIDKKRINQEDLRVFLNQCEIMFKLQHPNIVQIYQIYDNADYFYIVMQYMSGGQLCHPSNHHRCQDQTQIVNIVKSITDALDYCHSQKIVHRDIKPENILWSKNNQQAVLKIADFGFAKIMGDYNLSTFCGTPMYFAPQMLNSKPYNQSVDYWSLGVITYILLSGKAPFESQDQSVLYEKIKNGKVQFSQTQWKYISCSSQDFVMKLLERNPKKRYGAEKIRVHPWISNDHPMEMTYQDRTENLKRFKVTRDIEKMRMMIQVTMTDIQNSTDQQMIDQASSIMD